MSDYIVISEGSMGAQGATGATGSVTAEVQVLHDETLAARDTAVNSANAANLSAQASHNIAKTTRALLYADLAHPDNVTALVTNDTTNNGIYIKLGVSGAGSWQKSAYVPPVVDGSINTPKIAESAVTPEKTSFITRGKNIFNKATVNIGKYVSEVNGTLGTNASYNTSDYISVLPSTQYSRTGNYRLAYYDINKVFISGAVSGPITTPSNAAYMICSFGSEISIDAIQVEQGSTLTGYEVYGYGFDTSLITRKTITKTMTNFVTTGKNLFNKATATPGYYVSNVNGTLGANSNYYASDYISITQLVSYTESDGLFLAFFDVNKVFISGITNGSSPRTFTTPINAYYVRVSVLASKVNSFQLELGTTLTSFEQYHTKIEDGLRPDDFLLFLPSEVCVAVGRTIELYNSQVSWCGNINNYHFQWSCTIGKAMKRKFSVTGTSLLIGSYPLTLTVYDNNMNIVTSATTTIKIVTATVITKNILTIGDSLTNSKAWLGELRNLSGNQWNMVGTRGTTPLKHEGRSGWSAGGYLTGQSYEYESEGVNPFWDGARFNWSYYKTNSGVNPDIIQIFLGTNGMNIDPTTNAGNIKQIVDYIKQDDAVIPIYVVYTLYRGNQDGIGNEISSDGFAGSSGAWKLQEDRKVFNLMVKLDALLSGYSNLHFVPIAPCHDSEYNFGTVATPVNPRATQTELLPDQATHPQNQGYMQFADIMFSTMSQS